MYELLTPSVVVYSTVAIMYKAHPDTVPIHREASLKQRFVSLVFPQICFWN
jgi:hypothetical protein